MLVDYAFDKPVKIYVHNDEHMVTVSFLITPVCTQTFEIELDAFNEIIGRWRFGDCSVITEDGRWWWEYRDRGPRPACEPMEFVAISHKGFNYRLSIEEMELVEKEFHVQLNNKNHWD